MIKKGYLLLFLLIIPHLSLIADDGKAGQVFPFLKYGIGSRALGLGKAYSTISDDPVGIFWNPAGTARPAVQNWQLSFGYDQLFFDESKMGYFAGLYPHQKWGTFGLLYISYDMGDFIGRDRFDNPMDDFSVSQGYLGVSYAKYWGTQYFFKNLGTGLVFKSLQNSVSSENTSGVDMDLGLKWKFSFLKKANFAFSYQNLMKSKIGEDENVSAFVFGANYTPMRNLLVVADLYSPSEGDMDVRLGVEYKSEIISSSMPIFVRGGFSKDEISVGLSLYFRLPAASLASQVDYAFTNQSAIEYTSSKYSFTLYGPSQPCDERLYFMLADTLEAKVSPYRKFMTERFSKKADDLTTMTTVCASSVYGALANIILGNVYFYKSDYTSAIEAFKAGYEQVKTVHGGYDKVFSENTYDGLRDANLVVRYETHCNFAESFLNMKMYDDASIAVLEELKEVDTYVNPDLVDKPVEKYRYRFIYDLALMKFGAGKYDEALLDLNMVTAAPDRMNQEILNLALLFKARCYFNLNDADNAISTLGQIPDVTRDFNGLLKSFPNIEPFNMPDRFIVDDKLFWLAKAHEKKGEMEAAKRFMTQIVYQYPFSDHYSEAVNFLK